MIDMRKIVDHPDYKTLPELEDALGIRIISN